MPYDVKRFIFSVSLCAMLAVNPVLATAPTNDEDLGTTHDVYVESTLNQATNGIAGVSYVNRMVNAAGNAAELAEGHAAAAGAHALSAAQSADEAHEVLDEKLDKSGWASGMAVVTDSSGYVAPGYITNGMLANGAVTADKILVDDRLSGYGVLIGGMSGGALWGKVTTDIIANGAVTADKISGGAVTADKIGADTSAISVGNESQSFLYAYETGDGSVHMYWGQIRSAGIAPGAVTIDKTDGVVGMVPVGAADATTYGQFWIE